MAKKRMLIQLQLSNYDTNGKFILEGDSNWQIWGWRAREMCKLNPELEIDLLLPKMDQLKTDPRTFAPEVFESGRIKLRHHFTFANAPATRYDFNLFDYHEEIPMEKGYYDAVFINDPALLPNFKALFYLYAKYVPKFFLQIHFVDHPVGTGREKFPAEVSLWERQVEAIRKADWNFWMCQPTADIVVADTLRDYQRHVVNEMLAHSSIWDDGYSQYEASRGYNVKNMRFTQRDWDTKTAGKLVIFLPNRVGGLGRTSDYTHIGEFLFEKLPELRKKRQDFVVIAGNPSQKILNSELEQMCGPNGYISLVKDGFNRDEYHFVASNSDISVHLYDTEHHGGVASRECVEMGCLPLWTNCNEYKHMAEAGQYRIGMCAPDRSDLVPTLDLLMDKIKAHPAAMENVQQQLREAVRNRCAFERTTPQAMKEMGLL